MKIEKCTFGIGPDGKEMGKYIVRNANGLSFGVIPYGATLVSVRLPDGAGKEVEVTLGFDSAEGYLGKHPYFGSTVGRYANRIAGGSFSIGGELVTLAQNDGRNSLHGGPGGFSRRMWNAEEFRGDGSAGVRFTRISPDGEEGYPGELAVVATYTLTEENLLIFDYEARTDRNTVINLTNHAYWNLAGDGTIHGHELTLQADCFLPVDDESIPTGEISPVEGTPFDFRRPKRLGKDIAEVGIGYDHCFVVNLEKVPDAAAVSPRHVATLLDPESGRLMDVLTTQPGVQLYTGNKLAGGRDRGGELKQHSAVCLETQNFPNAVNEPRFPDASLAPGQIYRRQTVHRFFVG